MKLSFIIFSAMQMTMLVGLGQVRLQNLRTENLDNPIGLDIIRPRFSWQLQSNKRDIKQTAYELKVTSNDKTLWHTGKIASDQSLHISYEGPGLTSGERYYWQVRVWDNSGNVSPWSAHALFEMGFLEPSDWKALWITPGFDEDSLRASPLFRKEFNTNKKIKRAIAYITAHGLYEAQINGTRVGDAYLTPGWTSYNKRLQYQVYDVTNLLRDCGNAIGVTLGNGWYRGEFSFDHRRNIYGNDIALLFQLNITYSDGTKQCIISDKSWKSSTGAIRYSGIYAGEIIDGRLEKKGWTAPGYNDKEWVGAKEADFPKDILLATYNEPVKKHERIVPVKIYKTPQGAQIIDFGQNLVGWIILKVKGKAGDSIAVSHAEVLDKTGNFYTENLRGAKQQDHYILAGDDEETFEPHFTWHGFRYVKIEGYSGEIKPANVTAVTLYSAMRLTGRFTSSNPLINQLQHNIEWGLRGNFVDVPTDCPQRDERMGWTGDAQVFVRTASFLRDVKNFFTKWMKDVSADQHSGGGIPHVIPNVLGSGGGSAGWADVATIVPWTIYQVYGDKRILESQYTSMKAWVDYMRRQSEDDLWKKGFHFGDWLFYSVNDDNDGVSAVTNKYLIAQCFYAYSTQLLIYAAKELGKTGDALEYTALLQKIKDAFVREYTTADGNTVSSTQTSYVLALQFDMLPEGMRQQAADRLVDNIRLYKNHLTTGFLGTPYLCQVLSRYGYSDMAYTLLTQDTYPSWLYPVKNGATTIWERWNGIRPDGNFAPASMNSFNHYAYGAIGDWMYRVMVGLDNEEGSVGYKKVRIQPHIGGGFTYASASYETLYGKLSSGWKIVNDSLILDVEVPPNTTANVYVPSAGPDVITVNGQKVGLSKIVELVGQDKGYVIFKISSGKYLFTTTWATAPTSLK